MGGFRSTVNVPFQRAFDPSANFTSAGKLFSGIADRIDTRAKNKAINELLQVAPIQDEQVVGKGSEPMLNVPTGQVYNQSPLDFQQQQQQAFSQVNGIDPLMALGLAQKQATPYFNQEATQQTQSNADRLFGVKQDILDETKLNNEFNQGVANAGLVQTADKIAESKRHNSRMEVPTDIREANQAGYATGEKVNKDGSVSKYLTKEDFAKYQQDKAKARFSQRVLDPSTVDKNKASTIKSFDDILFKQLGKDGYAEYNKLPASERAELLQYWLDNGVIDFGVTEENTFGADDYGQGKDSKGYTRQTSSEPNVKTKTIAKRYPDGSVVYSDGTTGKE